jgi:hypothetical protein
MSNADNGTEERLVTVKEIYLEIVRKDEYATWKTDASFVGAELAKKRNHEEHPWTQFQSRFDISHLNSILAAWQSRLPHLSPRFFSYADVSAMVEESMSRKFEYMLDDLTWQCEYSVKIRQSTKNIPMKTLVIHLPNDGYFYINGEKMEVFLGGKVKRANTFNNRHKNACHAGWSVLDKKVWEKVAPFEKFMISWFGKDHTPGRMEKTILYHSDKNRVDFCMRHMDRLVAIEFSFEHSYPVALEDGWWDQF